MADERKLDMSLEDIAATRRKAQPSARVKASRQNRRNKTSPYAGRGGAPRSNAKGGTKVFVNNIAYSTTWQKLKEHMASAGNVVRADIMTGSDGRSKGFGVVEFASPAAMRKAINMLDGSQLDGREIVVKQDQQDGGRAAAGGGRGAGAGAGKPRRAAAARDLSFGGFGKGPVRLFVGNLNFRVQWFHLKDAFAEAGEVTYANVITGEDGRSKGFGVVEFNNAKDAQRAIDMYNGKEMDGRVVEVRLDRRSKTTASSTRVFVGNLAWGVTWMDLKDHFRAAGEVLHATVFKDGDRSKGCGLVEFATEHEAQTAIERLNDSFLKGRVMFVSEDNGAGNAGTGAGSGSGSRRTAAAAADASTNRVYVGNLSYKVDWGELKDTFRQWGEVAFAKVATEEDGRSRGWGIVEYTNNRDAATAIANADGAVMSGRRIFVREDEHAMEGAA